MKKTFDCIAMKRRGAAFVQARVAGKTRAEELAFWAQQAKLLQQRRARATRRAAAANP